MSGRRALVVGASRGIGRGIAVALARAGHDVVVSARSEPQLQTTVAALEHARPDGRAAAVVADVSDADACRALPAAAAEALGGFPEIVVHCAGIARSGPVPELTLGDWEDVMRVNVTSAFVLLGAAVPHMTTARWGRVVTVGSLYSRFGVASTAPYTASKHALLGLTRVLAAEIVRDGVTANVIVPGYVDTELVRSEATAVATARGMEVDEVLRRWLRTQPLGRMVSTREVGALASYLCSEDAAPVTGQAFGIDGGSYQG